MAAHVHVAEDRIPPGGVGAGRRPPPVAGGDLLRRLVVEIGRGAIADDATAHHFGRPVFIPVVEYAAAIGGRVIQDAAASHPRGGAVLIVDAAAVVGRVGADGAAIHRRGAAPVVDAAAVGGGRIGADGAAIHRRGAGRVVDAATDACDAAIADGHTG